MHGTTDRAAIVDFHNAAGRLRWFASSSDNGCSIIPGPEGTKPTTKGSHDRNGSRCDFGRACKQSSFNVRAHLPRPLALQKVALRRRESGQQLGSHIPKYEWRDPDCK